MSDIVGVWTGDSVDRLAQKLGLARPGLSDQQLKTPVARRWGAWGAAVGVTIGCLLGMTPLLFFSDENDEKKAAKAS